MNAQQRSFKVRQRRLREAAADQHDMQVNDGQAEYNTFL